jgi:hypothetical protein
MANIHVTRIDADHMKVEVREAPDSTVHEVKITSEDMDRFAAGSSAELLVEESFRFLLEREPKEAILRSFDLAVIAGYFPEFPDEIRRRLGAA